MNLRLLTTAASLCLLLTPKAHAILDINGNGLSDLWEKQYNNQQLLPPEFDPQADPDHDGWTNAEEAAAGTDPFNSITGILRPAVSHSPAFQTDSDGDGIPETLTPATLHLSWPSTHGKQYSLLHSSHPGDHGQPLEAPFIGNGNQVTYHIPATSSTGNFWRVATTDVDTDEDGLTNAEEHQATTNPDLSDTDGDGMLDGWEIANGLNPKDDGTSNPNDGAEGDPDGDGIKNPDDSTPQAADELFVVVETEHLEVYSDQDGFKRNTSTFSQRISVDRLMVRHPAPSKVVVPVAIASFDSQSDFGFLDKAKIRLQATSSAPYDRSTCFFNILDTRFPSILSESPSLVVREPVELKIPAGETQSKVVHISPGVTDLDEDSPDLQQAALMNKVEVIVQPIQGWENLDNHVDPWNKPIYGKRIFPDSKNPDDIEIRNKLEVVVKTSPALVGKKVFVKSFDVDDSTSDEFDMELESGAPIIDINGAAGSDNLTDYLSTPRSGRFFSNSAGDGDVATGTIDDKGETKFTFQVGMQPGNNYRVVASVIDESMYAGIQVVDPAAAKYLGPVLSQNGGTSATPLITVWRRLWVENDSMGEIGIYPGGDNKKNDLTSDIGNPTIQQVFAANDITTFYIPSISDGSSFTTLQNGTLKFPGTGSSYTPSNTIHNISSGVDAIQVAGNQGHIQPGATFRLYDDDGFGLAGSELPRNDLVDDRIKGVYRPAFIEVKDANPWNDHKTVDFYRSHAPVLGPLIIGGVLGVHSYGVLDDALDAKLEGNENLWCASVIVAYQPGGGDCDPNDEEFGVIAGVTIGDSPEIAGVTLGFLGKARVSIVYSEVVRDLIDKSLRNGNVTIQEYEQRLRLTAAHEIGHQPLYGLGEAVQHAEDGLMQDGGHMDMGAPDTPFTAKSIKRFRDVHQWRQKEK